jgi:hypothetical protein
MGHLVCTGVDERYITFNNLVIRPEGKTPSFEIDLKEMGSRVLTGLNRFGLESSGKFLLTLQ